MLALNHPFEDSPAILINNNTNLFTGLLAANFGAPITTSPIIGDTKMADPLIACTPLVGNYTGKIVMVLRGNCSSVSKALNAQNAGAVAVISKIISFFFINL